MIRLHAFSYRQLSRCGPALLRPSSARASLRLFTQASCVQRDLHPKIPKKFPQTPTIKVNKQFLEQNDKAESAKTSLSPDVTETKPSKPSLVSEVYTIPNLLTISRIIGTPFIGYFIATGHSTAAISLFAYSCITDFVDGFIARKYNLKTVLGSVLDPAADKFLMTTCTVALAIPGHMPLFVASLIIGRDVVLSFIAMYVRFRSLPPPKTLQRFLNLSIVTHSVHPNMLGKVNTALQMVYIGGLVLQPGLEAFGSVEMGQFFEWFGYLVAATTFTSGLSYLVGRNSFKKLAK